MPDDLKPLPVAGYTAQSPEKVALVNEFKADEERLLRKIDALMESSRVGLFKSKYDISDHAVETERDQRWLGIARTHIQEGFMALNRAIFQPQRIKLPEDE